MKKLIAFLLTSLLLTMYSGCSKSNNNSGKEPGHTASPTSSSPVLDTTVVIWQDAALEKLVRNKLGKSAGDIYVYELEQITELYIGDTGENSTHIASLEDLKHFKNLKALTISNQAVSDFSPLKGMTQLESLVLSGNDVKDLSFISGHKKINTLVISQDNPPDRAFTGISDIKMLEGMDSLEKLSLVNQNIMDLTPLSKLSGLTYLDIQGNRVEDLTPLSELSNLSYLDVQYNSIYEFSALRNLENLHTLYLSNGFTMSLSFLRNLPNLKETNLSEDDWKKIDYPFKLVSSDAIEGIYSGNIVNGGAVGFDGKNIYHENISFGDLGHPELVKFDNESFMTQNLSGQMTEQMSKILGQSSGGWINEQISYLNVYKGKLYFMGYGHNNDTADVVEDGYYPGDEVNGLARMNQDGSDRVTLAEKGSYISVAKDKIYCLNKDDYPISMDLDGRNIKVLLNKPCSMLYVDGERAYYQLKGSEKYLYTMNTDGSQPTLLLKASCNKPVILSDKIYYLNDKGNICLFTVKDSQQKIISKSNAACFNVSKEYICYSDKTGIYRMDKEGIEVKKISTAYTKTINVIGDYIFFNAGEGYCKIKNDGSEYTEYFQYF